MSTKQIFCVEYFMLPANYASFFCSRSTWNSFPFLLLLSYCRRRYSHCQQLFQTWPNCVCLEKIVNLARTPPWFGSPASVSQMYLFPFCFLSLFFTFSLCSSFFYGSSVVVVVGHDFMWRHLQITIHINAISLLGVLDAEGVSNSHFKCRARKVSDSDANRRTPICVRVKESRADFTFRIRFIWGKQNLRALCHLIHTAPLIPYLIKFCLQ